MLVTSYPVIVFVVKCSDRGDIGGSHSQSDRKRIEIGLNCPETSSIFPDMDISVRYLVSGVPIFTE